MSTLILGRRHYPSVAFRPVARPAFAGFGPAAEIVRDGSDAVVTLDLPGVDVTKDVTVELVDHALVVRGERRSQRADDSAGRSYREVRYGSFRRSFALPEHVSGDAVSASYDNGVLSIRVADAFATVEPTRIPVSTASTESTVSTVSTAADQPEQTEQEQADQADQEQAERA